MNSSTPLSTPDLASLRQAVQAYQPLPRRVPFSNLKPPHDAIAELRRKGASYATIAELLQQHGIKTSRARVAEYGRMVLEGGKSRKRRPPQRLVPTPAPAITPPEAKSPVRPAESSLHYEPRTGPRIARIRMADGSIAVEKNPEQTPR